MKKLLLLLIMISAALPAWAEDTTISLDEVVVTATRTDEEIDQIPANITVITQENIKESTAKTVQDLLRLEEGLIVRDIFGNGTKSFVDMRGFKEGVNTAVLIDGKKLNEIDFGGVDWNLIPLEEVERIEIVRGSGSVLYGDNAMAGVINIITKQGVKKKPEVEVGGRAESYGGGTEFISFRTAGDVAGLYGLLKNRYTNGYRDNSAFDAQDARANLTINILDSLSADLKAGYHTDSQGYPGQLTKAEVEEDRRQSTEPKNGADYWQHFYGTTLVFSKEWGAIEAGYDFGSREFDSKYFGEFFGSPYSFNADRDTDTNDFKLKGVWRRSFGQHKNTLVAGVDYRKSDVGETSVYNDPFFSSRTRTDLSKKEIGFYIEDEIILFSKWSVIAGYRYAEAKFTDTISSGPSTARGSEKFDVNAYRAGLVYNYADGAKLFANYSRGFRFPTTDELFGFNGSSVVIASLKPEKSDTYEIGIVHPFTKKIIGRLTLYHMDVRDEIFLNPSTGLFGTNENIEKTRHQGAELGFSAGVTDAVTIFGNLTYSKVTFESGQYAGNTLPLRPRYSANAGTDIRIITPLLLSLRAYWVDNRYIENDVQNIYEKLSDYLSVDAKLSYQYKFVTAYVGVNNILNKEYLESGAVNTSAVVKYYPAPERNYYAGLRFTF